MNNHFREILEKNFHATLELIKTCEVGSPIWEYCWSSLQAAKDALEAIKHQSKMEDLLEMCDK